MSTHPQKLLLATSNRGKIIELSHLITGFGIDVLGLSEFPNVVEVDEVGETFEENARLKAIGYARQTGLFALADDSGIEVEALGNRPGVQSARYGGDDIGFAEKMLLILAEMTTTGDGERLARFVCSMALADPSGAILATSQGECRGRIATEPRGSGGFGYDPIFIPDGFDLTFGELSSEVKQKISHRQRAFEQIIPFLRHFTTI